jgi:indolepyruvate ferredoxin oxidoreductase alpha subunit
MRELLLGNMAVARGAYEANVWVATGYPGTPSSEIIEGIGVHFPEIDSEWSVNEKVALEIAIGASIAGVRSICTMKHVGLNVAADPFMTAAYTGVNAGLVIAVADDPSMHSSQNEQDTRNYARFAKIPLFEPADSQEAKEFAKIALDVSEKFDTISVVRLVTRVCHTMTVVELSKPVRRKPDYKYKKDYPKYVMIPANARPRHNMALERYKKLREFSETFEYNTSEYNDKKIGIVTHGCVYNYVKEALPDASIFKVSMYPAPIEKIREFASKVEKLYVVEELDPIIETELKVNGIEVVGKEIIPEYGELSIDIIKEAFKAENGGDGAPLQLPPRPPQLCKGCGHIQVFEVLHDLEYTVLGDIGCYTLGVLPPYTAMDTTVCMGASVGNEIGFKKVAGLLDIPVNSVGVIGDSTFFHSGMTGLLNAVYNNTPITLIILDNRITAMTGHQPSPNTGLDNAYKQINRIDIEQVVRGLGVKSVRKVKVTPRTVDELKSVIMEEVRKGEPSVIIADEICVIAEPRLRKLLPDS